MISISGTTGEIALGEVPVITPEPTGHFGTILGWADEFRRLRVRTNADLPEDAKRAREFGAEGIGLCRTEHMFLGDRLPIVQRMILADTPDEETAALEQLRAQQESDFVGILEAMDGLPVTIRLLDPPLHEFLPDHDELIVKQAKGEITEAETKLLAAAEFWRESNPMLGTRGCRLGILKPGLYTMQVRALMQAAVTRKKAGGDPIVEIMIPLIVSEPELALLDQWVRAEADAVLAEAKVELHYLVGTMIETPRAALVADRIADVAEFFSFGTNDLTQMTFGFSRDDVEGRFMAEYVERKLLTANPFDKLDVDGVGQLVRMGCERGRATRPDLKLGICGEHGGDPDSVAFCHEVGLDYVSCSPFRVPIARLATPRSEATDRARPLERETGVRHAHLPDHVSHPRIRIQTALLTSARQNSLPSGSVSTTQSSCGPVAVSTRAPNPTSRAVSASRSSQRRSRCTRFLTTFDSGTS